MGFYLEGFVLRPARFASGNGTSTNETVSGVSRDHISPAEMSTQGYQILPSREVEPYADMYRAALLEGSEGSEACVVWAASTGNFATLGSPAFAVSGDPEFVLPSSGDLTVGIFDDGTSLFFVSDAGGRAISEVTSLVFRRGDNSSTVSAVFSSQDPAYGRVVLNSATLTSLGGGFSRNRGDTVLSVSYELGEPTFWWSKNESTRTRFTWDGKVGRWTPIRGGSPQSLGAVSGESTYKLSPPLTLEVGEEVPGDPLIPEQYAQIRVGTLADSNSTPLSTLVVSEDEVSGTYPGSGAAYDAVVGVSSGTLLLNPTFISANSGLTLWFNSEIFPGGTGEICGLSELSTTDINLNPCLSPVPESTENPFIRIGSRRYLQGIQVDADSDLGLPSSLSEGTFQWSAATGKIVLSQDDIQKAIPGSPNYDIAYLESVVFYDGVSCSSRPVTMKEAIPLVNSLGEELIGTLAGGSGVPQAGDLYIPRSLPLPAPGMSGVLEIPDGTGTIPSLAGDPEVRPNGTGLVRSFSDVGDTFIFTSDRSFEENLTEEYDEDLPVLQIRVKRSSSITSKMSAPVQPVGVTKSSRVQIKRSGLIGSPLFFRQAQVCPSVYCDRARIWSRKSGDITLTGTEVLRFNIDGSTYEWDASVNLGAGTFSPQEISDDLNTFISGAGTSGVIRGRVFLESDDPSTGRVEIGWNTNPNDLSGNAALGFLPGWLVDMSSTPRWLPDNGSSLGLFRSPENLDSSSSIPDVRSEDLMDSEILTTNVPAIPFYNISNPPLEDVAGFDANTHFSVRVGLNTVLLQNYGVDQGVGVKYDFTNDRIVWTESGQTSSTGLSSPSYVLQLSDPNILPETLSGAAMDPVGSGFGLFFKAAGDSNFSELDPTEFLMVGAGGSGQALLISEEGAEVASGGGGSFTLNSTSFSNPNLSPSSSQNLALQLDLLARVDVGDRLQILSGASAGLYNISSKALQLGGAIFGVDREFLSTESQAPWRILEGQPEDVFDPTIVADQQLVPFNHLPVEPWEIWNLSPLGEVGSPLSNIPLTEALARGREIHLRVGLTQPPQEEVIQIELLERGLLLGAVSSEGLEVPDVTDPHFAESAGTGYIQLRIGGIEFNTGNSNLSFVSAFSVPIPSGVIEVGESGSGIEGEIEFSEDLLSDLAGEQVYFDQLFLLPASLSAGTCEVLPGTGEVNLSAADLVSFAGQDLYFLEQLITENSLDVTISPTNGSILINTPLRSGQLVETRCSPADSQGNPILDSFGDPEIVVEYLSIQVRLEEATVVNSKLYQFNPTGRTFVEGSEFVWVGAQLQNFAGRNLAAVNGDGTISFVTDVPSGSLVRINYLVLEAFGGEQAFTVSSFPVYRKPFFLEAGQNVFTLEGDRTNEIVVGQLLQVAEPCFYVKSVVYSGADDSTEIEIWPSPETEVGSRAPGKDSGFFLSSSPMAITVDPADPVVGGGSEGFLLILDTNSNPFAPADVGQLQLQFEGDVRRYTGTSHLLEIGGFPHLVTSSSLSEDGRWTTVQLSSPLRRSFESGVDEVRVSARPVYPPLPTSFSGISPLLLSVGHTLFILPEDLPGRALTEGVEYEIDSNGSINFKSPNQGPLQPGEALIISYTAPNIAELLVDDGAVVKPYFKAKYLRMTTPSTQNGLLGSTLSAKYRFRNPDSFFYETVTLQEYLGDVAEVALVKASPPAKSFGPIKSFVGSTDLSEQGALGLRGNIRDLKDQDRAARAYIELYNKICVYFEQILETLDGRVIGDRDGKFKFFQGHGKNYSPPGYEDAIEGDLALRDIWNEIVSEWSTSSLMLDGYFQSLDPIYDPTTGFEKDPVNRPGETDGNTPNPSVLSFFINLQKARILNDMDDQVLVGFGRPRGLSFLLPSVNVPGSFKKMWEAHKISRIFPETTKHFTRLLPGLESVQSASGFTDPGFYSAGRRVTLPGPRPGEFTSQSVQTNGTAIGTVANPVFGNIQGVVEVTAQDRLPRARVLTFFPNGSTALDSDLGVSTVGLATFISTPLPLSELPLDASGFPDPTTLLSEGGSLIDLVSGDPELSTPGFEVGQRVQYGTPQGSTGTLFELSDSSGNGVFVGTIQRGCVVTLASVSGSPLSGSDIFTGGVSLLEVVSNGTGRGDTLYVVPPTIDVSLIPASGSSPTMTQIEQLAQTIPDYRIQFDLKVGKRTGEFLDSSLPTREDFFPLPLQNMFGQRPPQPLTCIEGKVEFVNTQEQPLKIPALLGESKDDSGDVQIPYITSSLTELDVLGQLASGFSSLLGYDTTVVLPYGDQTWAAVYPDEVLFNDGELHSIVSIVPPRNPATLYTGEDLTPVQTAGIYTPGSALGDVRSFDLVLVEAGQPLVGSGDLSPGSTGIIQVGSVSGSASLSSVEPPRFVTKANRGSLHHYTILNAFGHLSTAFPSTDGVVVTSSFALGIWTTVLDFSSISGFVFDSDNGTLLGGILALLPAGPPFNAIVVNFYDPDPLSLTPHLGSIVIPVTSLAGTIYAYDVPGLVSTAVTLTGTGVSLLAPDIIQIQSTTSIVAALPAISVSTFYDTTLTIDTQIDGTTSTYTAGALGVATGAGSTSCEISEDRLTFNERVSFASTLPRNSLPANGDPIELGVGISVPRVTVGAGADCSVNAPSEVNGGDFFTLQERVGPDPDALVPPGTLYVGTFSPGGAGTENGKLRMMAWEGFNNTASPILSNPLTEIVASAIPSSNLGLNTVIYEGTAVMRDSVAAGGMTQEGTINWLDTVVLSAGDPSNVEPGDLVVVSEAASGEGAVKTGTYLARSAVSSFINSLGGVPLNPGVFLSDAGGRSFLDLSFPTIKSLSGLTLTLKGVPAVSSSPTFCGFPDPTGTPYVYLILKNQYTSFSAGSYTLDGEAIYRIQYSALAYNPVTKEAILTLDTGTAEDAIGNAIADSLFISRATRGTRVSGMTFFSVAPNQGLGLPPNNVVGWLEDDVGTELTAGFLSASLGNVSTQNHGTTTVTAKTWDKSSSLSDIRRLFNAGDVSPAGTLGIRVPTPEDSTEFYSNKDAPIYGRTYVTGSIDEEAVSGVAAHVSLDGLTTTLWNEVHFDTATGIVPADHRLYCLLPGDRFVTSDSLATPVSAGFFALGGIFLEPSFPRSVTDLDLLNPHVVSASNPLTGQSGEVGSRNVSDFVGVAVTESVRFEVRRIRRFHQAQNLISDELSNLRYVYTMRVGEFSAYNSATRVLSANPSPFATNLGDFDDSKVNLNAGDEVRILDSTGNVLDTAEIQVVNSGTELTLRNPGLTQSLVGATSFQIWMKQPSVPQEQSAEQLLEILTDTVVLKRVVNYGLGDTDGGRVSTSFNQMQDSLVPSWSSVGVQEGDYVIVDPARDLYTVGEKGAPPRGDRSTTTRAPYVAGGPSALDDNRGFYRVEEFTGVNLQVSGASRFSGGVEDGSDDVVFGDVGAEYVVLPTVHDSTLTSTDPSFPFGGQEGQQALRPTAPAVLGEFNQRSGFNAAKSIEPFGYTIIRPSALFSEEAAELILFNRERVLSLVDLFDQISSKGGDYYTFQEDDHIDNLGNPSDPVSTGFGLVSNGLMSNLEGLVAETPFANDEDCLSILDRRFWGLDFRLDVPGYSDFVVDGFGQRPVLPDLVEDVLNLDDRIRDLRYAWINFRANRVDGSLVGVQRAEEQLPKDLQKQRDLLRQKRSFRDS